MASNDYFMRQIEGFTDMLSTALFGEKSALESEIVYESAGTQSGHDLLIDLRFLVSQGRVNDGEDLLFHTMERNPATCYLAEADQFYAWLDQLDDGQLREAAYTREEIGEGREAVRRFYARGG